MILSFAASFLDRIFEIDLIVIAALLNSDLKFAEAKSAIVVNVY